MTTRKTSTAKSSKAAKPAEPAEDKAAKPAEPAEDKAAMTDEPTEPVEAVDVVAGSTDKHPNAAIIAKVVHRFRDKDTLSTFQPGATIAVSPERFEEICAAGDFLERIQ